MTLGTLSAMTDLSTAPSIEPAVRVSTLELFFDLVFVFTVTQLTSLLVHHLEVSAVLEVLLLFGITWWMYGGYAWLTNAVAPSSTTRRTLLLTGMAGFLVMALAIPGAFHATGWQFGLGYFVVNLVHSVLFVRAAAGGAFWQFPLGRFNMASALLVLVGGTLPMPYRAVLWSAAFALQIATPYLHRMSGYWINAGHFVERHGLVVIIVIGESIVAIGAGLAEHPLDWGTAAVAVLGLTIAYYLWWAYFAGDDARAEHVLAGIDDPQRKARTALRGWGYAHYPMVLGIIGVAAGVKLSVGRAFTPLGWGPGIALAGGAALFLLGHAWFLGILRLSGVPHRVVAAVVLLATIPLVRWVAVAELVAVPLVMATALIIEDLAKVRRTHSTEMHTFGRS
jgi:low temperature requirement protein LtrA